MIESKVKVSQAIWKCFINGFEQKNKFKRGLIKTLFLKIN